MYKTLKVLGATLFAVALIGGGCSSQGSDGSSAQAPGGTPIKVGFIGPLTGDASSIGTVNKAAVEVAVDEVNKAGGVNGQPLQVVYEDGQCNAKAATNAANKLMNVDNVPIIIGGLCSTETAAFAPGAMQKKVIVISYGSSAPSLSKLGKYFFRSYPSDAFQGKYAAEYAYNTLNARKIAVVYHISDWGTGIKDVFVARFKELGGTIVATEGQPQESRDYRTVLSKIKGAGADYIYAPTYPEGGTVLLKQASQLGIKTPFLGADAWADLKLQKEAKGDIVYVEPKSPPNDAFNAKILAKTGGKEVPIGTPNAYDNVMIIVNALKSVGPADPDKLADAIRATKMDGVSGHIEFDGNGDITQANYQVKRIANGTATLVQ